MAEQAKASKQDVEKVRDLFGLAHDLIAQAQFPGHVSAKVVDVMQFLAYQYNDFKARGEALAKVEVLSETPAIPVVASAPGIPGNSAQGGIATVLDAPANA